jgi:hypothetical protein
MLHLLADPYCALTRVQGVSCIQAATATAGVPAISLQISARARVEKTLSVSHCALANPGSEGILKYIAYLRYLLG